ncbi:GGDEF domain-containing protein [Halomonas maura]|uniref:GGDEF domain-containing protein n=1 Tax=Halomonas maura TaxID=117606 RepID=UPI0025B39947|nr:GGDEF domain-containing protein [Halomonas maura]MDN3555715.1 GGDEF domain-containing protein [Halomonas maura]
MPTDRQARPSAEECEQQARLNAAVMACGIIGLLCYLPFDYWMVPERWPVLWVGRLLVVGLLAMCLAWQHRRPMHSERVLLVAALGAALFLAWGAAQVSEPFTFFFWNQSLAVAMFILLPVVSVWRPRCMLVHNGVMLLAYGLCFVLWSPFTLAELLRLGGVFLLIGWLISPLLSHVRYGIFHRTAALSHALRERNAELTAANEELAAQQQELTYLANFDAMTGLANRRWGMTFLRENLDGCYRRRWPLSVLLVDIDRLKAVNDSRGHASGDRLICHVARAIAGQLRNGELACRLGGDEFLMIMPDADADEAGERARRLSAALESARLESDPELVATVSVGAATYRPWQEGVADMDMLIQRADSAMYSCKRHSRRQTRASDEALQRARRRDD